jgi:hypothetical protein
VVIRQAVEADVPFIFNSWLKSYRASCRSISNPVYFEFQHKTIEALLKRCQVQVACNATDANQLYGYIVYEQIDGVLVVHYCYIKDAFRRIGLLPKLAAGLDVSAGGFYTHDTRGAAKLLASGKLKFMYNPYLAFGLL